MNAHHRTGQHTGREMRSTFYLVPLFLSALGCGERCAHPKQGPEVRPVIAPPIQVLAFDDAYTPVAFRPTAGRHALVFNQGFEMKLTMRAIPLGETLAIFDDPCLGADAAAFSPDGSMLATQGGAAAPRGKQEGATALWKADNGALLKILAQNRWQRGGALAFAPDGKRLAALGPNRRVQVFDLGRFRLDKAFGGDDGQSGALAFTADGTKLAWSGNDSHLHLYDFGLNDFLNGAPTADWIRGAPAADNERRFKTLAASLDGGLFASAGGRVKLERIELWDQATGNKVGDLFGHADAVCQVAFRQDSRILASISRDKTIRLWDPRRRELLHTITLPGAGQALAYSPDGRYIAAAFYDEKTGGKIGVWDLGGDPTK